MDLNISSPYQPSTNNLITGILPTLNVLRVSLVKIFITCCILFLGTAITVSLFSSRFINNKVTKFVVQHCQGLWKTKFYVNENLRGTFIVWNQLWPIIFYIWWIHMTNSKHIFEWKMITYDIKRWVSNLKPCDFACPNSPHCIIDNLTSFFR